MVQKNETFFFKPPKILKIFLGVSKILCIFFKPPDTSLKEVIFKFIISEY
jgi:hypothetical protein